MQLAAEGITEDRVIGPFRRFSVNENKQGDYNARTATVPPIHLSARCSLSNRVPPSSVCHRSARAMPFVRDTLTQSNYKRDRQMPFPILVRFALVAGIAVRSCCPAVPDPEEDRERRDVQRRCRPPSPRNERSQELADRSSRCAARRPMSTRADPPGRRAIRTPYRRRSSVPAGPRCISLKS